MKGKRLKEALNQKFITCLAFAHHQNQTEFVNLDIPTNVINIVNPFDKPQEGDWTLFNGSLRKFDVLEPSERSMKVIASTNAAIGQPPISEHAISKINLELTRALSGNYKQHKVLNLHGKFYVEVEVLIDLRTNKPYLNNNKIIVNV